MTRTLRHGASLFIAATSLLLLITTADACTCTCTCTAAPAQPDKNIDLVKQICDQQAECLEVLYSHPKTHKAKDLKKLADIALDLGSHNATKCVKRLKKLHSEQGLPEALYPVLLKCASLFQTSAQNFHVAKGDLEIDPLTANYDVMIVTDGPRDCDRLMADANVTNAEVQALGNNIRFFAHIGGIVTTALGG